jgi:AbrB family looped-hinge helix DNA binding protein
MNKLLKPIEVHLGRQGRIVIPASLRQSLKLETGDKLIIREEEGRIILEKQNTIKQRLKNRYAKLPKNRSLANELIGERRKAAQEESAK